MRIPHTTAGLLALLLATGPVAAHQSDEAHVERVAASTETPAEAPTPSLMAEDARARAYFTDTVLLDQDGRELRFYSDVLKDRIVVINFIFTDCQDACPLSTQKLKAVRDQLGDSFGRDVFFVSISIDPENDTPQAMREFAEKQNALLPRWIYLTGSVDDVNNVVKRLGQFSDDVQAHSTMMLAGNVPKAHWTKIAPMATVPQIAAKIAFLAGDL